MGTEGYRIRDDLYIAGQEELGAIDLNAKEFRYCREENPGGRYCPGCRDSNSRVE